MKTASGSLEREMRHCKNSIVNIYAGANEKRVLTTICILCDDDDLKYNEQYKDILHHCEGCCTNLKLRTSPTQTSSLFSLDLNNQCVFLKQPVTYTLSRIHHVRIR